MSTDAAHRICRGDRNPKKEKQQYGDPNQDCSNDHSLRHGNDGWTAWLAMKVKWVPALRERGLRRGCVAEPRVLGLALRTSNERKTDTMKTYLLRAPVDPAGLKGG